MPQSPSQATLAPGTMLSKRYRVEELIGSGGYASVYRATDMQLGYERAIKEVRDPDPGVRTQFRLEAELLINSRHPNIPHGYHLIEDFGRLYLIMDYVHGKDLEEMLNESLTQRQRPLEEAQVLRWAIDICSALDEMHNLKVPVIHRDIKPANIKITSEGWPVLIDFGLAKLQKKGATMTAAQGVSPGFAPPEQYMAKGRTDPRTDIYGLGATLYACLTGKDPPEAPGRLLAETGAGGTKGMSLVAPKRINPRISEETDRIIMRSLELSPNNRQQSARMLRDELTAASQKLGGLISGSTMVMGMACPRCGTQNRPEAMKCVNCGAPLRGSAGPMRTAAALAPDISGTGKRPAAIPPPQVRGTGKQPAVGPAVLRAGTSAEATGDLRAPRPAAANQRNGTAKQPAVAQNRSGTGKQPAIAAEQRGDTGKQPVQLQDRSGTGKQPAAAVATATSTLTPAAAPAATREATIAPLPAKVETPKRDVAPVPQNAVAAETSKRSWLRLGTQSLSGFSKVMLTLASIETLWGVLVLSLGTVAIIYRDKQIPTPQLVLAWVVVALIVSFVGAQVLSRPIYRRGHLAPLRRWLQGIVLVLFALAVHGVAIWGITIFEGGQGNSTLALLSFMIFGVNVLVVGALGIANILW